MTDKDIPYTVSVVIPAYNAQQYITNTLDSVLAQTYKPLEIVVVDDGSTDNTASVAQQYIRDYKDYSHKKDAVKEYADIRYIHRENGGAAAARNTGIKAAKANWVAFIDADDEWLPEKLQLQMAVAKENPELVWVMCNYYFHLVSNDDRWLPMKPEVFDKILAGRDYLESYFTGLNNNLKWNPLAMVVKRDVFEQVGYFKEGVHLIEDIDMWLRIAYKWPQIGFVNEPLAVWYCGNEGSFTRDMPLDDKFKWYFMLFDRQMALAKDTVYSKAVNKFIANWICYLCASLYPARKFDLIRKLMYNYRSLFFLPHRLAIRFMMLPVIPDRKMFHKLVRRILGQ